MKLRTTIHPSREHPASVGYTVECGYDTDHDAAAAHALMQEIAILREAAERMQSSAGRLTLTLLDSLDQRANALMRQWGYEE